MCCVLCLVCLVFLVCFHKGRSLLLSLSVYFLTILLNPQMPPRRANPEIPPEIAQLLATQNQLIQLLTQNMQNNNNPPPPPPPPPPPQQDRLTRFLRLNPPTFTSSTEPIIADDCLRTINKKLDTVQAVGADRVCYAAHPLEGPAVEWWDNY